MNIDNKIFEQLSIADLKEALRRKETLVQRLESKIALHTKKIEEYHNQLRALGRRTSYGNPAAKPKKNTQRPKDGLTIRQIIGKILKDGQQRTCAEIIAAANKAGLVASSGATPNSGNISAILSQNPDDFKSLGNGKWTVNNKK